MKKVMMKVVGMLALLVSLTGAGQTKTDEKRMEQDIEVAENILSTLMRQQFGKRNFMPMEVNGTYTAGYGVTFRVPQGSFNMFMIQSMNEGPAVWFNDGTNGSYSYSYSKRASERDMKDLEQEMKAIERQKEDIERQKKDIERQKKDIEEAPDPPRQKQIRSVNKVRTTAPRAKISGDSLASAVDKKLLEVAKNFMADYGDVLSQLKPEEKIIITNRSEGFDDGFGFRFNGMPGRESRRTLISVEARRDDIGQLKQGKITRDQFLGRLKIVDTETADKLDPDLEVLSSMFGRLYSEDLSKTYFTQGDVTYERLKDFGVIYYMKVYSSNEEDDDRWSLPTVSMEDLTQEERDKKVKELYPVFESELKDNILEYGRTLRSLKEDEQLVFNVRLTKCTGCGIPSAIELSVKNSVLKDYSSGKINKEAALAKVNVKKVGSQ
jgi:hypothetical protein